jgi:hypothetical protein
MAGRLSSFEKLASTIGPFIASPVRALRANVRTVKAALLLSFIERVNGDIIDFPTCVSGEEHATCPHLEMYANVRAGFQTV